MYAQALEPKNSNIKLCLNWTSNAWFARHWAETELDGKMVMFVEKAVCDMGVAAKGKASSVVSLKYDDDEVSIIENELKICNSNEVKLQGGKRPYHVSLGPRVWCGNSSIVDACDKKECVWLVADAQPASDRSIYYDAMAIGSWTLKDQVETGQIFNEGNEIPIVQPDPRWKKDHHNSYQGIVDGVKRKITIKRFVSEGSILKCGKTKEVFRCSIDGKWNPAPSVTMSVLYIRDLKAVCLNPAVKGAVFIPGGDAKAVVKAVRAVAKVDGIKETTLRAANLRCSIDNMDIWVKSVFLAQDLLGDILKLGDRFTDFKDHTAFEVDDQIVEATVATLQLWENGQLCFKFVSELQKETSEQDGKWQPLSYYASACLVACRSFTEAELKRLDIELSSARLAQLGGFPLAVAFVLPTDPGSYPDGMGVLQTGACPDLDDFRAKLKHGRFPRKERSAIDELLKNSFCFKRDVPERAKALGRTYIGWRDATGNSMPGVPTVPKPASTRPKDRPRVVSEPDHPTNDHGWGLAKMREKVQI